MNNKDTKTAVCKVQVISPLHIGDGEEITPLEFFESNNKLVVYNLNKRLINDSNFLEELLQRTDRIKNYHEYFLRDLLTNAEKENKEFYRYTIDINENTLLLLDKQFRKSNRADIRTIVKDVNDHVYIPGSSLKGALRTAFAYMVLREDDRLRDTLERKIKEAIIIPGSYRNRVEKIYSAVEDIIFRPFKSSDAKKDIFRMLRVSDLLSSDHKLGVVGTKTLARRGLLGYINLLEAVMAESSFEGEIDLNIELGRFKEKLGWKILDTLSVSTDILLNACRSFYGDLIRFEKQYFQRHPNRREVASVERFYNVLENVTVDKNETLVRIGMGSGYYWKTLALLLMKSKLFTWENFLRRAGRRNQAKNPTLSSRVVIETHPETPVLGWVKLTLIKKRKQNA